MDFLDTNADPDKVFSYNTQQQVNIQDRWLGFTNLGLQLCMLIYIVCGVFIYAKGYLEFEEARGQVALFAVGDAYAVSNGKPGERYFSIDDLTYPGLENGNIFVSTRQTIYHQKRGLCEDHTMPCESDADCSVVVAGKCQTSGFCMEEAWCNQDKPEVYELAVDNVNIWVKSSVQFVGLAPERIYSNDKGHDGAVGPEQGYNVFTVRELLMKCEPVPVRYEEVAELGAAIEVQFLWNCDVKGEECHPTVDARRLDVRFDEDNIGYSFSYAHAMGEDERRLHEVRGVRIYFRSTGRGRKVSWTAIIMKVSLTSALLFNLPPILADLLMLKVFNLRKKFFARKYDVSQDFSDYIEAMERRKAEEAQLPNIYEENDQEMSRNEADWQRKLHEED